MNDENVDHGMEYDPNEEEEEEDEEARLEKIKDTWNPLLLKSAQKGDLEGVKKALDKGAHVATEDKKCKWNALLWAACKGYEDVVRYLITYGAGQYYSVLNLKDLNSSANQGQGLRPSKLGMSDDQKPKVQLGQINASANSTPLMWACSKGHYKIVWLLLREGLDWRETDSYGNNCVHMAASSNSLETLQSILEWGVTTHQKNSRGHYALDLTTEDSMKTLLSDFQSTTLCEISNKPLEHEEIKYLCHFCKKYYSKDAVKMYWMYEHESDEEKDRPEMRCKRCDKIVEDTEKNLNTVLKTQAEDEVGSAIES